MTRHALRRGWAPMVTAAAAAAAVTIAVAPSSPRLGHDFTTAASPSAQNHQNTPVTTGADPQRLVIDHLNIDAPVTPVQTTVSGKLAIPADVDTLGWYSAGAQPGSPTGSVLIVGHLDAADGQLGTLAALFQARPGDLVTVQRHAAPPIRYRITQRRTVPKQALPPDVYATTGAPRLNVITCSPPYQHTTGYLDNLVITATPTTP